MKNIKIVIDKRKLDTLLRLGCPDSALIETIKTGKAKKTGDSLIDDYLQTFFVVKTFSDKWGGNHNPKGKNKIKSKDCLGQLDRQDEGQDVDIDKDIDNIFSLENKKGVGEKENLSLKESSSLKAENPTTTNKDKTKKDKTKKDKTKTNLDLSFLEGSLLKEVFESYLAFRKEIKKPYKSQKAVVAAFEKLERLAGGSLEVAEKIVEQSLENQWQGLFPLKEESKTNKQKSMAELYAEATNW